MSQLFSRLESLSAHLNQASDSLNDAIKTLEAKLASLRLGVEAWVEIDRESDKDMAGDVRVLLGYARCNGNWCLAVSYVPDWDPEDSPNTPLQQASRELRLKAFKHIPALIQKLEKASEETLAEVEKMKLVAKTLTD